MSRANSISAVDALGTFIDTLRDLGYTPDEVKGALILYASPMPASPPRGMTPLTVEQIDAIQTAWIKEGNFNGSRGFARAIEAAHGIGTPPQGVDHG